MCLNWSGWFPHHLNKIPLLERCLHLKQLLLGRTYYASKIYFEESEILVKHCWAKTLINISHMKRIYRPCKNNTSHFCVTLIRFQKPLIIVETKMIQQSILSHTIVTLFNFFFCWIRKWTPTLSLHCKHIGFNLNKYFVPTTKCNLDLIQNNLYTNEWGRKNPLF